MARTAKPTFSIAKNVNFSSPLIHIKRLFTTHTRWFYILLAVALFAISQLTLSLNAVASRPNEPTAPAQTTKDLEKEPAAESKTTEIASTYQATPTYSTPLATSTTITANAYTNTTSASYDHINLNGRIIPIFYSNDTQINAGSQAGLFGRLLYGHNTNNIFGDIASLPSGSTFSITLNNHTVTYSVVRSFTLPKSTYDTMIGSLSEGRVYYGGQVQTHSLILMTCAGTIYGNGDASHRTIVTANAI